MAHGVVFTEATRDRLPGFAVGAFPQLGRLSELRSVSANKAGSFLEVSTFLSPLLLGITNALDWK